MAGWTTEGMRALLGLRGAADVQAQLNVVSRKKVVHERAWLPSHIPIYMSTVPVH